MTGFYKKEKGVALLITLIIIATLVASTTGVASIFLREIRLSGIIDDSIAAIMAADAGMEKKLYDVRKLSGVPTTSYSGTLSNGATYITCPEVGSCTVSPALIMVRGIFGDTQRALQITY